MEFQLIGTVILNVFKLYYRKNPNGAISSKN